MNQKLYLSATLERATRIDAAGVLRGVAVITEGPARGHLDRKSGKPIHIDRASLESIRKCAAEYADGLKVKMTHDGEVGDIVGVLREFRIEGTVLRADFHLLKTTPHRGYILEIAQTMPDQFGLSVAFRGVHEVRGNLAMARCEEIFSADLVSEPAANRSLFSKPRTRRSASTPAKFEHLVAAFTATLGSKTEAIRFCVSAYPREHHNFIFRTNEGGERISL